MIGLERKSFAIGSASTTHKSHPSGPFATQWPWHRSDHVSATASSGQRRNYVWWLLCAAGLLGSFLSIAAAPCRAEVYTIAAPPWRVVPCVVTPEPFVDQYAIKIDMAWEGRASCRYISLCMLGGSCYAPLLGGGWAADGDVTPVTTWFFEDYPNGCDSGPFRFVRFEFDPPLTIADRTAALYVKIPRGYQAGLLQVSFDHPHPTPWSGWYSYTGFGYVPVSGMPAITAEPTDIASCPSGTATFAVETAEDSTASYLWQWQPTPSAAWTDLADGVNSYLGQPALDVTGATDATLHTQVILATGGDFRCIVSNACGSVTSDVATLTILDESDPACTGCPACPADFDNNGGIDGADLSSFFYDYEAGEGCADVDQNGGIDGADLAYFFTVYEAGGC